MVCLSFSRVFFVRRNLHAAVLLHQRKYGGSDVHRAMSPTLLESPIPSSGGATDKIFIKILDSPPCSATVNRDPMDNKTIKTASMVIALAVLVFSGAYLYRAYQKFRSLPLESHIQRQMEKATGMKTEMEGASVRILGGLELVVTNASMGNPGEGFFLRAERASIRFSLWHILLGRVKLARIKLLRPYIQINRKASREKRVGNFLSRRSFSSTLPAASFTTAMRSALGETYREQWR